MNELLLQHLKDLLYFCNQILADSLSQREEIFILGSASYNAELPLGSSFSAEQLMVLLLGIFLLFKFFSGTNTPPKKKIKQKKITFQEILMTGIGTLKPIGNNIYEKRKLISKKNDVETYLTVTKIDRSHIRVEEKQKAESNYTVFVIIIFVLIVAMLLQYLLYGFFTDGK